MFSKPESAEISNNFVAVRLLGGHDLNDEGRAFAKRYGVRGFPTMLAMNADGGVLHKEFQRDVDGILEGMLLAGEMQARFQRDEAALKGKTDAASVRALAELYKQRLQYEAARSRYESLTKKDPQVDDQVALLEILQAMNETAAAKALLGTLVKTQPDDARAIEWRIALQLADVPKSYSSREEAKAGQEKTMAALSALLGEVKAKADQAMVRLHIARILNGTRDREAALEHWEWILEHARDSAAAPEALMQTAGALFRGARGDADLLEEVQALLQEIVDKHASHPAASDAKKYIVAVQKSIDKARAEAGEADSPGGG